MTLKAELFIQPADKGHLVLVLVVSSEVFAQEAGIPVLSVFHGVSGQHSLNNLGSCTRRPWHHCCTCTDAKCPTQSSDDTYSAPHQLSPIILSPTWLQSKAPVASRGWRPQGWDQSRPVRGSLGATAVVGMGGG